MGKGETGLRKEYEETFGGYEYIHYLDCDDGFTYSYVKTSNFTP